MKYCELTISEKAELREDLFLMYCAGDADFECFSEEIKATISNCDQAEDIPEETMEEVYGGYSFVEEDFFCNTEDQFCDRNGGEYKWNTAL